LRALFSRSEFSDFDHHVPNVMEILLDYVDRFVMKGEALVDGNHEALDCDEKVLRAFIGRMPRDFTVEVCEAFLEEALVVVADLFGGAFRHDLLR
jgi:hypothetical protein